MFGGIEDHCAGLDHTQDLAAVDRCECCSCNVYAASGAFPRWRAVVPIIVVGRLPDAVLTNCGTEFEEVVPGVGVHAGHGRGRWAA